MPPRRNPARSPPPARRPVRACTRSDLSATERVLANVSLGDGARQTALDSLAREQQATALETNAAINSRIRAAERAREKATEAKRIRKERKQQAQALGRRAPASLQLLPPHKKSAAAPRKLLTDSPRTFASKPAAAASAGKLAPRAKRSVKGLAKGAAKKAPKAPGLLLEDKRGRLYRYDWKSIVGIGKELRHAAALKRYPILERRRARRAAAYSRFIGAFAHRWRAGKLLTYAEFGPDRDELFAQWENQTPDWRRGRTWTDRESFRKFRLTTPTVGSKPLVGYSVTTTGYESDDGDYRPQPSADQREYIESASESSSSSESDVEPEGSPLF